MVLYQVTLILIMPIILSDKVSTPGNWSSLKQFRVDLCLTNTFQEPFDVTLASLATFANCIETYSYILLTFSKILLKYNQAFYYILPSCQMSTITK